LRDVSLFELQTLLNNLAEKFSESIVKPAFVNLRSIMKVAKKLKVLAENPSEDLEMPVTRPVESQRSHRKRSTACSMRSKTRMTGASPPLAGSALRAPARPSVSNGKRIGGEADD